MATPLSMEKFGRIEFSLGKWITRVMKPPNRYYHISRSQENLSEFFFINYCGRSDHFYMASRLIVLNKVDFSRYSWIGFVKVAVISMQKTSQGSVEPVKEHC